MIHRTSAFQGKVFVLDKYFIVTAPTVPSPPHTSTPRHPPSALQWYGTGPSSSPRVLIKYICLYYTSWHFNRALHSSRVTYGKHCLPHCPRGPGLVLHDGLGLMCVTQVSWRPGAAVMDRGLSQKLGKKKKKVYAALLTNLPPSNPPRPPCWILRPLTNVHPALS